MIIGILGGLAFVLGVRAIAEKAADVYASHRVPDLTDEIRRLCDEIDSGAVHSED